MLNLAIIFSTPYFPEIMSLSKSNTASWVSPSYGNAMAGPCFSNDNTMAGPCFSVSNEVNFLQILTSFSQSSYEFVSYSDGGVLLILDIVATGGVFLVLSTKC